VNAPPRYVLGSVAEAQAVLRRLGRQEWRVREGFDLPESAWDVTDARLVLHGRVADADDLELAVHAGARGAGLVVVVDERSELAQAILADLSRLGEVRRTPDDEAASGLALLTGEQRSLLGRLANGETIAAAAAAEFLSLRTANRRIAQARADLGVRTTREAVLAYLKLTRGESAS
jgi:DNA-binding NarL/FixJ family response regulator